MEILRSLLALPTATVGDLLVSGAIVVTLISGVVVAVYGVGLIVVGIAQLLGRARAWRRLRRLAR